MDDDDEPQSIGRIQILHTSSIPSRLWKLVVSAAVVVSLSGGCFVGGGCFIFHTHTHSHQLNSSPIILHLQEVMSDEHGVDPTGTYHGK